MIPWWWPDTWLVTLVIMAAVFAVGAATATYADLYVAQVVVLWLCATRLLAVCMCGRLASWLAGRLACCLGLAGW